MRKRRGRFSADARITRRSRRTRRKGKLELLTRSGGARGRGRGAWRVARIERRVHMFATHEKLARREIRGGPGFALAPWWPVSTDLKGLADSLCRRELRWGQPCLPER